MDQPVPFLGDWGPPRNPTGGQMVHFSFPRKQGFRLRGFSGRAQGFARSGKGHMTGFWQGSCSSEGRFQPSGRFSAVWQMCLLIYSARDAQSIKLPTDLFTSIFTRSKHLPAWGLGVYSKSSRSLNSGPCLRVQARNTNTLGVQRLYFDRLK